MSSTRYAKFLLTLTLTLTLVLVLVLAIAGTETPMALSANEKTSALLEQIVDIVNSLPKVGH
jgi:hypothetical protein